MGATPTTRADRAGSLPWTRARRAWQNRNRLAWKYRRYLIVRALPTVLIVAGYPFAVTLVLDAVSWKLCAVLMVSGSLAPGSAVIIRTYGGAKEIAASRLNIRVYWAVIVAAGVVAGSRDVRKLLKGLDIIEPLYGLATIGLVMLMVANARSAAKVAAAPKDGNPTPGITSTRLTRLAASHCAWDHRSIWRGWAVKWGWSILHLVAVVLLLYVVAIVLGWPYLTTGELAEPASRPWLALFTPALLAAFAAAISHRSSRKIVESFSRSTPDESHMGADTRAASADRQLTGKYRAYLVVQSLPTVLIVASYPFAIAWAIGTAPWTIIVVLLVSSSLAIGSHLMIQTYGGPRRSRPAVLTSGSSGRSSSPPSTQPPSRVTRLRTVTWLATSWPPW